MLLSDRDLRKQLQSGRLRLDPFDVDMLQPSSIDMRLDKFFRIFNNTRYTHIDPAARQDDLTTLVETEGESPFVLHPGEFVLGSTYELVGLPDDLAGRLEGKALALDTEVPTPTGWTTMGALQPGDLVLGADGEPVRVVAATEVLLGRDCYRVTFSDHHSVIADAQHQWLVESRDSKGFQSPAVRTTREIAETVRYNGMLGHRVPAVPIPGEERALPVDPYALGVWLGDGTSTSAEVTLNRLDAPEIAAELTLRGVAVGTMQPYRKTGSFTCRLGGRPRRSRDSFGRWAADDSLNSTLRLIGLLGNKHIPADYLRASYKQRWALLQGLLDTDGYVNKRGDQTELTFTNRRLARGAAELIASLGIIVTGDERPAKLNGKVCGTAYRCRFRPIPAMFLTSRRSMRARATAEWVASVYKGKRLITSVEQVPSVPVRCIQVANEDGIFLVGRSFIPTHNSSLGRLGLLVHSTAGFIDPGFSGHITLELSNVANLPITLWPGMKIGQLCLFQLSSPAEHPYGSSEAGSRYQGQRGPTASRSWLNFHRTEVRGSSKS